MSSKSCLRPRLKVSLKIVTWLGIIKSEGVSVDEFYSELKKVVFTIVYDSIEE
jgi:hypothetical protein